MTTLRGIGFILGVAAFGAVASFSTAARAHFYLQAPACFSEQDFRGDPQKASPCGTASNLNDVTTYEPGETITIMIEETVPHPGHYRVALAINDINELPADPPITQVGMDPCGSTVIDDTIPGVLADGMLPHDDPFDGPQSFQVTLPDDVECDNCILQVMEYMSSHGAPCFYYHCANIAITAAGGTDPGGSTSGDSGDPSTTGDSGTSTSTGTASTTSGSGSGTSSGSGTTANDTAGSGDETATGSGTDSGGEGDGDSGGCSVAGPTSPGGFTAVLGLCGLLGLRRRRG